jgi:hypothetical protein
MTETTKYFITKNDVWYCITVTFKRKPTVKIREANEKEYNEIGSQWRAVDQ